MCNEEIECLKRALKTHEVMWIPDSLTARTIKLIGSNSDEPSPVAYFENGEFLALDNCVISEFAKVERFGNL